MPRLAEHFAHVHVSDAKSQFIDEAKKRLDKWSAMNPSKGTFSFSVTPAEKADEPVVNGCVDLVTLMQCAHWTDQDAMTDAVVKSLAPTGTLAIVSINPSPCVVGNEVVKAAVNRLFTFWMSKVLEFSGGPEGATAKRFVPQHNSGVDSVPLSEDLFTPDAVKRIEINTRGRGKAAHAAPGYADLVAPSRASALHQRYEYSSEDPEGEGWQYDVEAQWFRGYLSTLARKDKLPLYESHLRETERAIRETTSRGMVTIEWTVAILLAKRA